MKTVYIGLGSNLDHPILQLREAIHSIRNASDLTLKKISHFYRSKPLARPGLKELPDFINAVIEIETHLSAQALLYFLQGIETAQKRIRSGVRWGSRTIDLDILLFGNDIIQTSTLQIPHPGLSQREFVLYPLAEIAPDITLPSGEMLADLKARCPMRELMMLSTEKSEAV